MTIAETPAGVTAQSAAQHWAEALEGFRSQHGREPSEDSDNDTERRIARAAWGYRLPMPAQEPVAGRLEGTPGLAETQAWWNRLETYLAWKVRGHQPDNGLSLNSWLYRQRRAARDGRLPEAFLLGLGGLEQILQRHGEEVERADAAAALANQAAFRQRWFSNLDLLARWQSSHGTMPRRDGAGRERKLALWVECERTAAREGLLVQEQLEALASVPGALSYPKALRGRS